MTEHKAPVADAQDVGVSPKEMALFAARALHENLAFCLLVALIAGVVGCTLVAALPQYYDATCKIFVQDGGAVTSSLASGRDRYRPIEGTRGLQEFILARDNLLSIVREAKLVDTWPNTRPWPMRLKDRVMEYLVGPPDRGYMERAFVEMLAASVSAAKDGEGVRIHAQWRDKQSAYEIARLLQRNFLAARAAHDLGPIQRAIPFLEQQLQEADKEIEAAVSRLQGAKSSAGAGITTSAASPALDANTAGGAGGAPSQEVADLSRRLSEIRSQQRALTEPRRRRVAELKLQLIDMKASYSDDHPLIRQQEARIETLSAVPEELAGLREQESRILSVLSSRGAKENVTKLRVGDDPELAASQARLITSLRKSDETMAKLENARIELATADADFKHRYVVVEQPEVPSIPQKAKKKPMMFLLAVVAALAIGTLAGAVRELRKGQLVEVWQVRQLGVELLGEVELE